jgi:glycosyltransferase involved in cell wall biosynthesis
MAQKFPHSYLALAGSGDQESKCRELIQKLNLESRIHLLGYRTDTANLLSAADIYLLPTKRENLSMSLLEALAAGLPIITTPVGGNLELVQAEKTAILADAGNIAALSGALERLLQDQQLRQAMGARAYESVHRFSLGTVAHQHITLYQEIISAKSSKLTTPNL